MNAARHCTVMSLRALTAAPRNEIGVTLLFEDLSLFVPIQNRTPLFRFNAFSSREPVSTSLENAPK
jgi:hypothetical protein